NVFRIAQIDLGLYHAVEARTGAFETGRELAFDDVIGFELDRPLPPKRARMTHLRIERPLAIFARFAGLPGHEAEIAGAERRAVARDRRNIVARLERLVPNLDAATGDGRHDLDLDGLAGA